MDKTQHNINKYLTDGGKIFRIKSIDKLRDGGTGMIKTNRNDIYYIDKDNHTIHNGFPTNEQNKINNNYLISFIIEQISKFIEYQRDEVRVNEILLNKLIK